MSLFVGKTNVRLQSGVPSGTHFHCFSRLVVIQKVKFTISGMTCASCEEHVNHEVNKLTGIISSNASYENGNAIIEFDNSKTNISEIEKAINSTGYSVTDKKEN